MAHCRLYIYKHHIWYNTSNPFIIDPDLIHSTQFAVSYMVFCLNVFLTITYLIIITLSTLLKTAAQKSNYVKFYHCPCVTHFGDTASDIGVLVEFNTLANKNNNYNYDDKDGIPYGDLFVVTLTVLILYRIVASIKVYDFSDSKFDVLLQFFDLYVIKTIGISVKINW